MDKNATRPRLVAFASTDCHTCLSRKRNCPRQRPYCSTCLDRGIKCGGYATALSWHESRAYISHNRERCQQASGQMLSQRRHKRADRSWIAERLGNVRDCRFAESQKSAEGSRTTTIHSQNPEPSSHDQFSLTGNHHSPNFLCRIPFITGASAHCAAEEDFAGQVKDGLQDFSVIPIVQATVSGPSQGRDLIDGKCLPQSHQEESAFHVVPELVAEESSLTDFAACDPAFDTSNYALGRIGMNTDEIQSALNPLSNTALISSSLDPTLKRKMLLECCEYLHENGVFFVALVVLRRLINVVQIIQIFVSCH